jgi:DNA polymerase III epsilon subunit-like protein
VLYKFVPIHSQRNRRPSRRANRERQSPVIQLRSTNVTMNFLFLCVAKHSLSQLTKEHCDRTIQVSNDGTVQHDSAEDAIAALELFLKKIQQTQSRIVKQRNLQSSSQTTIVREQNKAASSPTAPMTTTKRKTSNEELDSTRSTTRRRQDASIERYDYVNQAANIGSLRRNRYAIDRRFPTIIDTPLNSVNCQSICRRM